MHLSFDEEIKEKQTELLGKQVWRSKLELITQKTLHVHFFVYPVGKEIM